MQLNALSLSIEAKKTAIQLGNLLSRGGDPAEIEELCCKLEWSVRQIREDTVLHNNLKRQKDAGRREE